VWKNERKMKVLLIIVAILALAAFVAGGKYVGTRNELVTLDEAIKGQWAQVDNALQRRADLIPNLVETVKGFAKQEREVFASVANARAAMAGARNPQEKIAANDQLNTAL